MWIGNRPVNDGPVVLTLAGNGDLLTGLAARAAPLAVVKRDGREPFAGEALREWLQPAGLDGSESVRHHDRWVGSLAFRSVDPRLYLVSRRSRDLHCLAGRGGCVVGAGHRGSYRGRDD